MRGGGGARKRARGRIGERAVRAVEETDYRRFALFGLIGRRVMSQLETRETEREIERDGERESSNSGTSALQQDCGRPRSINVYRKHPTTPKRNIVSGKTTGRGQLTH